MTEPDWLESLQRRLRECGLAEGEFSVAYQDDLQDHAVRIAGSPKDDVLARLADFAASTGMLIDFDHRPTWERYAEALDEAEAPSRQAAMRRLEELARAELAGLRLLEGCRPIRRNGTWRRLPERSRRTPGSPPDRC